MDNHSINNLEKIKAANQEMLSYFNSSFLSSLEEIQELKTQAFEIDIKIDELEKTKDLYAFKTTSRKSVFTPVVSDGTDTERGKIINQQIEDLLDAKSSLSAKIRSMENSLNKLKKRLALLNDAEAAIDELSGGNINEEASATEEISEDFEFIEEAAPAEISEHGYNILMLDAFDKAYLSTLLEKNVIDSLSGLSHKLDIMSYLVTTDVSRARLTLQEIILNSKKILSSLDEINVKLNADIDQSKPISFVLDEFVMQQRERHPECVITANIQSSDFDLDLHPVFTINIFKLLNIFFDNIYRHSNATQIDFKAALSENMLDITITDNGVGIGNDYLKKAPWYSSLHKAQEIIYLLGGKLEISGDVVSGTRVRFSFSVKV